MQLDKTVDKVLNVWCVSVELQLSFRRFADFIASEYLCGKVPILYLTYF